LGTTGLIALTSSVVFTWLLAEESPVHPPIAGALLAPMNALLLLLLLPIAVDGEPMNIPKPPTNGGGEKVGTLKPRPMLFIGL
jgi:hypothetical protein